VRLDITHPRPPLTVIPRAWITLSATATVTITIARQAGSKTVPLAGTLTRRLGSGEKYISLVTLLGGRQTFVPGIYRVALSATTSDGRTAKASTLMRMLKPKPKKQAKQHR
jgi:hypothetical protein